VFVHVQDAQCCEVNVFELVSLKKTLVSDVFGKSCRLFMWYMEKKKCPFIEGFLTLCFNVKSSHDTLSVVKSEFLGCHFGSD